MAMISVDVLDDDIIQKLLRKGLIGSVSPQGKKTQEQALTTKSVVTMSNAFTSLQNAFNTIYANSTNVKNLHTFEDKRLQGIRRENTLESKPTPVAMASGLGEDSKKLISSINQLGALFDGLSNNLKKLDLSGPSAADIDIDTDSGKSKKGKRRGKGKASKLKRLLRGAKGGALLAGADFGIRLMEGDSLGRAASAAGAGGAGAWAGAEAGAAIGALFGPADVVTVPLGGLIGGALGYFGGSAIGEKAYDTATAPKQAPNAQSTRRLEAVADRVTSQQKRTDEASKPGPTSYSAKLAEFMGSTVTNVQEWVSSLPSSITNFLGPAGAETYQAAQLQGAQGEWAKDADFINAVNQVARNHNINANDLLGVLQSESGINPASGPNKYGYGGIIGFGNDAAASLGTTVDKIRHMSAAQQMPLIDRLFSAARLPKGANAGQIYAALFMPGTAQQNNYNMNAVLATPGTKAYAANKGLDYDGQGGITIADLFQHISKKRQSIGLGPAVMTSGFQAYINQAQNLASQAASGNVATNVGGTGVLTSGFGARVLNGKRENHPGIDLGAPEGTPVAAMQTGTISFAQFAQKGSGYGGYGNVVVVDQDNGYRVLYAHLSAFAPGVAAGQRVNKAQIIGAVGSTGMSTGNHLHFEVRKKEGNKYVSIDPLPAYKVANWVVGGQRVDGTFIQPTPPPAPGPGLPQVTVKGKPYYTLPGGAIIPVSAKSAKEVPGYGIANNESKRQIELYFDIKAGRVNPDAYFRR